MTRPVLVFLFGLVALSASTLAAERDSRHLVVVNGIGGEAFYRDLFHRWAVSFMELAEKHLNINPDQVFYLAEDPTRTPQRTTSQSRKEEIERILRLVAESSKPEDLIMLLLIGHGTARDNRILFNLPGPDMSASELSEWLDAFEGRRVIVINASSASGPFVPTVARPGRVVITATSSAAENQQPRFGGHFVTAFAAPVADRDKDGRVSLLEAFVYATGEVERDYERENRLRTEHALLDDDGDGIGTRTPGGEETDGRVAARIFMTPSDVNVSTNANVLALTVAARALVDRIELLKRRKQELSVLEYETKLESLLLQLALNRQAYRKGLP
ncbi:MAG: hypothetical protein QNI91_13770 [Arenicellales bacterium]|nr:hypothetical protein [Arenicellales bacterium]